jgi:hypothetical protein
LQNRYESSEDFQNLADWIMRLKLPGAEPVQGFARAAFMPNKLILGPARMIEINIPDGVSSSYSGIIELAQNMSYVAVNCSSSSKVIGTSFWDFNRSGLEIPNLATPFTLLRDKVGIWSEFETGWDGEDGIPPPAVVVANAFDFIDLMEKSLAPIPSIYIAGDGEIGFRWTSDNARASVSFLDDGYVVGFCPEYLGFAAADVDGPYIPSQSNPAVSRLLDSIRVRFR